MEKRVKTTKAVSKLDAKPATTSKSTILKAKTAPKAKRRIELWSYDEYNQGSIIFSSTDIAQVVERAHKYVTETNVDNALTAAEKDKHWAAYFVEIFKGKKPSEEAFYAGNKTDGRHYMYVNESGDWKLQSLSKDVKTKFFLGELNSGRVKEPWYLADHKGVEIDSLSDQHLERKTIVFIKVV